MSRLRRLPIFISWSLLLSVLAGCGTPPSTHITEPFSAIPTTYPLPPVPADGAIFQANGSQHPLFEDMRARNVGDTLEVILQENSSALEKSGSDANHATTINSNTPSVTQAVTGAHLIDGLAAAGSNSNKLANTGDSSGSNILSGTITVTVVKVLPNGNLVISGQKIISINQVDEYIRLSGVINPVYVQPGDTVLSTQVADARIEYKGGNANMDQAALMSMLNRFFLSSMPF